MSINTTSRAQTTEIMDDFSLAGETLRDALDKIAAINRFLGGNQVTLQGVAQLLRNIPMEKEIAILDVGCGNGDMLRALANYGRKNNRRFRLIGVDANVFTVDYARKLSKDHPNIEFICMDVFSTDFADLDYDIALATLTLHHFTEAEILSLLAVLKRKSNIGIVVNDLQRSALAYRLFQGLAFVCRLNHMSREDGLVSILRGFKKHELKQMSNKLGFRNAVIRWKWAFRYQWIITL